MMVLDKGMERVPLTFTRASVAYDYQGNSVPVNTPRFEHLIGGNIERGVLIEEAHTNLLTANQSTCTDTTGDTTGFNVYLTTSTISSSTEQALQGTKSLKIITKGETTPEGIKNEQTVTNGVTYTFSAWVYAPLGAILRIQSESTYTVFTGTGAWQNVSVTHTQSDTLASLYITTHGNTQAITFYVDMLQLTATAYPLSWTLGGTTQAAETLQIGRTDTLGLGQGSIELEAYINSVIKTNGITNDLIDSSDGSGNNRTLLSNDSSNNLTISTKASAAATTVSYADSNLTLNSWTDIGVTYNATNLKLFTGGTSRGTPSESPNLPATQQTVYLGSKNDGTLQANTLIRNVVMSRDLRSDTDITARSNTPGFGADREVTLFAPLTHNLQAYKMARG